jgi:hypothetical protein
VRLAFSNLNAVLHAAGCTFDDVVDVTMFVVNPEANFETVWSVVPEFWGEAPYPTLTGIGVTAVWVPVRDQGGGAVAVGLKNNSSYATPFCWQPVRISQ